MTIEIEKMISGPSLAKITEPEPKPNPPSNPVPGSGKSDSVTISRC